MTQFPRRQFLSSSAASRSACAQPCTFFCRANREEACEKTCPDEAWLPVRTH
jgi:hypothetical protein